MPTFHRKKSFQGNHVIDHGRCCCIAWLLVQVPVIQTRNDHSKDIQSSYAISNPPSQLGNSRTHPNLRKDHHMMPNAMNFTNGTKLPNRSNPTSPANSPPRCRHGKPSTIFTQVVPSPSTTGQKIRSVNASFGRSLVGISWLVRTEFSSHLKKPVRVIPPCAGGKFE